MCVFVSMCVCCYNLIPRVFLFFIIKCWNNQEFVSAYNLHLPTDSCQDIVSFGSSYWEPILTLLIYKIPTRIQSACPT